MNSDIIFKKYLGTWPYAWIMWPEKGKKGMENFFSQEDALGKLFNDLLSYIKEESTGKEIDPAFFSCTEWVRQYFNTERGRKYTKGVLNRREKILAEVAFNIDPLKSLLDGFIEYFISNREAFND